MKITSLGSCQEFDLNGCNSHVLIDGTIVDPRNKTLMEMDAINLYYGYTLVGSNEYAKKIIYAVLKNLEISGEFWCHNAWGKGETHYRFTSSVLRLLASKSVREGSFISDDDLYQLLEKHFSYHEEINGGIWFFHDSIEFDKQVYPHAHIESKKLSSSVSNMLILNTHLDTLTTLLFVSQRTGHKFESIRIAALGGLDEFLSNSSSLPSYFELIDMIARNVLMYLSRLNSKPFIIIRKVFSRLYYRHFRSHLKRKYNVFCFSDGFTERDLCLIGPSLNYHVINVWDAAKLLFWLANTGRENELEEIDKLRDIYLHGLRYCFSDYYFKYLGSTSQYGALCCQLLESIILGVSLGLADDSDVKYIYKVLGQYPYSNGLLGIDPLISGDFISENIYRDDKVNSDIHLCIKLASGDGIIIMNENVSFTEGVIPKYIDEIVNDFENRCEIITSEKIISLKL